MLNRTRTQDGFTDAVSNLGQTEVVLHCCQLPVHASTENDGVTNTRTTFVQTDEVMASAFSPSEPSTSTGPVPSNASTPSPTAEAFSSLSSSSSTIDLPATSTPDSTSTESSDQIQSAVEEGVDLVKTRTGTKINELRRLLEETASGSLFDALDDLVATLINISGTEAESVN